MTPIPTDAEQRHETDGRGFAPFPSVAEALLAQARIAIERARAGRSPQSVIVVGQPAWVSDTLQGITALAGELDGVVVRSDASTGASLPALLSPALAAALHSLKGHDKALALVERTERRLAGFTMALQAKFPDLVRLDGPTEAGLADNGDLEFDLAALLESAGQAARAAGSMLVLVVDGLHHLELAELGALIAGLHRCAQSTLPVLLIGGGEPALRARAAMAKSYAERSLVFIECEAPAPTQPR